MKDDYMKVGIKGNINIVDDTGKEILNCTNDIHPQNMARIIARGLAHEDNSYVYRIAFGNGGTNVDAAYTIQYNTPNIGQGGSNETFDSRLYNETYSEIVDESSANVGTDPGSADSSGTRPGGGSSPDNDTAGAVNVVSNDQGITSNVVVTAILNSSEPVGQSISGDVVDTRDAFVFDEIALYTSGAPASPSAASVDIDLKQAATASDPSGLGINSTYDIVIVVDGVATTVTFTTPQTGTGPSAEITFGDLVEALNTNDPAWTISGGEIFNNTKVKALITNDANIYPSIINVNTNGKLRFVTVDAGAGKTIGLSAGPQNSMVPVLSSGSGTATITASVDGRDQGLANDPNNPSNEQERLLTHAIVSPIVKSASRTFIVTYTLTIAIL